MAFKLKTFAAVGALIGSLALVGCGQDEKDPNHIKVGVIVGAEQQVAEVAQKVAKEKYGLDVELVTFNDYVLPIAVINWWVSVTPSFIRLPVTLRKLNHWTNCSRALRLPCLTTQLTLVVPCCCCRKWA